MLCQKGCINPLKMKSYAISSVIACFEMSNQQSGFVPCDFRLRVCACQTCQGSKSSSSSNSPHRAVVGVGDIVVSEILNIIVSLVSFSVSLGESALVYNWYSW